MESNADTTLAFVVVDGCQFDFWENYSFTSSLFDASGSFEFSSPIISDREQREINGGRLVPGKIVQAFVRIPSNRPKASLQFTGILTSADVDVSREGGAHLKIAGRNHLFPIVDSDVLPGFSPEDLTFADLIKKVLIDPLPGKTFGFYVKEQIVIDNDASRALLTGNPKAGVKISKNAPPELETLKVDQAKPHAGETIFHYLQRHATRFGLMIWGTADGKIVVGRPNYEQRALYDLDLRMGDYRGVDNNVKHWHSGRSFEHRASEYHVYGHSKGGDSMRSPIHAVVYDDEIRNAGLYLPATFHDNNARTQAQAEQRAKMEMGKRLQNADQISALVAGHGESGSVWSIDTIVSVSCDAIGLVNEPRYIVSRTITRSRERGTETRIVMTPKNAIVLGDVQYVPPKTAPPANFEKLVTTTADVKSPLLKAIATIAVGKAASSGVETSPPLGTRTWDGTKWVTS